MSWVKRRGANTPNATPHVPMYNPNQHSTQEVNQWPNPQSQDNWYTQQQQYQQKQGDDLSKQQQHGYWQQPYDAQNYNQHYELSPYENQYRQENVRSNISYNQEAIGNNPYNREYSQNNVYGNAQNMVQQQNEGDAWNQAWGDEDNFNINTHTQQRDTNQISQIQNTEDTFGNDGSWNWSLEDASNNAQTISQQVVTNPQDLFSKIADISKPPVKQSTNYDLPSNNASSNQFIKRGKLDTPQWSTESQVSQESSDDILQTSESDKSHKMSHTSTVSQSPLSGHDMAMASLSEELPMKNDGVQISHFENKEIISIVKQEQLQKIGAPLLTPRPSQTPPVLPPPPTVANDDSKNMYKATAGLSHNSVNKFRTSVNPATDRFQIFHNQQVNLETVPDNSEQPDNVPPTQSFPKVKSSLSHLDNNEVLINDRNQYLETGELSEATLGELSEQTESVLRSDVSDSLPPPGLRRMIPGQMEQAESWGNPNHYNQGQDDQVIPDPNDTLPPPGLRRMVPGQMEHNEIVRNNNFGSEPPSGLSRMVVGHTERVPNTPMSLSLATDNLRSQYNPIGPPEGLHRMIPGESSSPESNVRRSSRINENDSDPELQQLTQHTPQARSATIGADTPPTVGNVAGNMISGANRLDIIGGSSEENQEHSPATGSNNLVDNGQSDKNSRTLAHGLSKESTDKGSRRDSIEGEPQENKIGNITKTLRNLTVGENLTDGQTSNTSFTDSNVRRLSRQESSDSEEEQKKQSRILRDKRTNEKFRREKEREKERTRDRNKDRYSPDSYRGRRYDRRRYKDRYDDETDFYSDKEKERSIRDDIDYEAKFSSLRKEKDKDRHRKDLRDYRRDDHYYGRRYQDEYDDERSRPSSRSDSTRDAYRDRHDKERRDRRDRERERDKDRYRRRRDPREVYNPYQGYAYDPYNPYYQQYQYYENLRRTNPQAYAEWYHKYYQQMASHASSYGGEDRASVHSGRSSANDELTKDSFSRSVDQSDSGAKPDGTISVVQRLTPVKFTTAHLKASISSGKLLKVLPHYSIDEQGATVEISSLQSLLILNEDYRELNSFPGPLVKGVTHKKTIIEYCENKIRHAMYNKDLVDADSYILMWELLILLIRQNGMVVGTDIAELLLKNREEHIPQRSASVISNVSSSADIDPISESSNQPGNNDNVHTALKEEEVTNKFREYLLYGSGQEALEWAMKHGLWGHALFLASKLDKRTYANVMMRFANGLTLNDPLQTLYQLLSGKMPAAITCISDEKWGDWRPHLAMILSNSKQRPELICKAITSMGDTLRNRGSLYAAQFCYLMAEVGFGKYDDPETRMVLLGANHSENFPKFATNEAIHMTEIYEYACGLNSPDFVLPQFQTYKYLLATRLADYGLLEKSLAYLEAVSLSIIANPGLVHPSLINKVYNLADKLKFYDPVGEVEDESEFGGILETSRLDHSWLKNLRAIQDDYQTGLISHQSLSNLQNYDTSNIEPTSFQNNYDSNAQNSWVQYDQQYLQPDSKVWQAEQVPQNEYLQQEQLEVQQSNYSQPQYQEQQQQNYWPNQQQWPDSSSQYPPEIVDQQPGFDENNTKVEDQLQPQITLPNQAQFASIHDEEPVTEQSVESKKSSPVKPKTVSVNQDKTQNTGWFGGIFSKLSLKPKNQMKLPDDNNPKIVYDQEKKRWVNLDEDPNDPANELKPPPKMADIMQHKREPRVASDQTFLGNIQPNSLSQPTSLGPQMSSNSPLEDMIPSKSSHSNMFKLQRSRNLKNSYVDVFNPSGKPSGPTMPIPDVINSAPGPQMNFFIPQPTTDPNAPLDFLTPGGVPHLTEQQAQ